MAAVAGVALLAARRLTGRQPPDPITSPDEYGLPYEDVTFLSEDGITLRGWFMPAVESRGTIIFCAGHSGSMDSDLKYAPAFHRHGYNVLMFDFRAHGRSGGNLISFGYHERKDVLAAIRFLKQRGINHVGLLGFSMGAGIAMLSAPLSPAVRAVVSDSGFATLDTIMAGGMQDRGIPAPIAGWMGWLILRIVAWRVGRPLHEAYPIHRVDRIAPRGLFLIHGSRDIYVPEADARALYERAGEPKDLWIEPDARHREIDTRAGDAYMTRILAFFDRFFPCDDKTEGVS